MTRSLYVNNYFITETAPCTQLEMSDHDNVEAAIATLCNLSRVSGCQVEVRRIL